MTTKALLLSSSFPTIQTAGTFVENLRFFLGLQRRNQLEVRGEGLAEARLLIGASSGLLCLDRDGLTRLFIGNVYGITKLGGRWYFLNRLNTGGEEKAQVLSATIVGHEANAIRIEIDGLPGDIHQIDFIGHKLYLSDTRNNRLLVYQEVNGRLNYYTESFPNGPLLSGVASENYCHLNSVYAYGDQIYLVYHNQTSRTRRPSSLAILDKDGWVLETRPLGLHSAHNIIVHEGNIYCCDSGRGRIMQGDAMLVESGGFPRGLAIQGDRLYFGVSQLAARNERNLTQQIAYVAKVDLKSRQIVGRFSLLGFGCIREVRLMDGDTGLSNNGLRAQSPVPQW